MAKGIMQSAGAVAKSPVGFARGIAYALRGMRFVYLQHPGLARYWVFPIAITAAAIFAVFYGAGSLYDDVGAAVWSLLPESWSEASGFVGWLVSALRWSIELIAGLLITLLGLVLVGQRRRFRSNGCSPTSDVRYASRSARFSCTR